MEKGQPLAARCSEFDYAVQNLRQAASIPTIPVIAVRYMSFDGVFDLSITYLVCWNKLSLLINLGAIVWSYVGNHAIPTTLHSLSEQGGEISALNT